MGYKIINSDICKLFASGSGLSLLWRGILSFRSLIEDHVGWKIGSGRNIPINHQVWWPLCCRFLLHKVVADLLKHNTRIGILEWNEALLHSLYRPEHVSQIQKQHSHL